MRKMEDHVYTGIEVPLPIAGFLLSGRRVFPILTLAILSVASSLNAVDWASLNGPNGNRFVAADVELIAGWEQQGPPIAWVAKMPGVSAKNPKTGYAGSGSAVIVNGRAYFYSVVLTDIGMQNIKASGLDTHIKDKAARRLRDEKLKAGKYRSFISFCIDIESGQELWRHSFPTAEMGWLSSATPCVDAGRVYYYTTCGGVLCLDAENGHRLWSRGSYDRHRGGYGNHGSLLAVQGYVLTADLVLDGATGKVVRGSKISMPQHNVCVAVAYNGVPAYFDGLSMKRVDSGATLFSLPEKPAKSYGFAVAEPFIAVCTKPYRPGRNTHSLTVYRYDSESIEQLHQTMIWGNYHTPVTDGKLSWVCGLQGPKHGERYQKVVEETYEGRSYRFLTGIVCIENETGVVKWQRPDLASSKYGPAIVVGDRLISKTSAPGFLQMLDARSGETLGASKPSPPIDGVSYRLEAGHTPTYWRGRLLCRADPVGGSLWDGRHLICYDLRAP